ncbi:MAG: c-type cytochrome domain-containing protein [Bdellovibrionales bacterium]
MMNYFKFISLTSLLWLCSCADYRLVDPTLLPNIDLPSQNSLIEKTVPEFDSINKTIIIPKCLNCHSPGGRAEDVPFDSYEGILATIVPGEPDKSDFYLSVLPNSRRLMPPTRSGIPPLNEEEIQALRNWILDGANNINEKINYPFE